MGIPAIGTQVGGIPDLIADGKTGFLLPAQPTPEDVARAVMKYTAMPDAQKENMASEARELWKQKFDAQANARHFAAYLQNLITE